MNFKTVTPAFSSDQSGSVAILLALMMIVLSGSVGLAVDYGRAVNLETKLQAAADVTALAVAKRAYKVQMSDPESANNDTFIAYGKSFFCTVEFKY